MKRIIWTRPIEDWQYDLKIVKSDSAVLHFPVTRQILISPQFPSKACDIVILTSRKAAEAFLQTSPLHREQLNRVEFLTFGMETYKFLVAQNLKVRLIPVNNGKDFAQALVVEIKKGSVIWFPRPAEPAFAVGDFLRTYALETYDIEMYRTEAIRNIDAEQIKRLIAEPSIVCFASPSAVRAFVDIIRSSDEARFYRYIPVAIGSTTMSSGQSYFPDSHLATHPTLQSLWEKAQAIAKQDVQDARPS
ncbi:MAG: uroporphyrinogen-III synthase [Proteobacteria bacterium]|nr:uroporphyrinogen-III synthase [Pseudomonadota bacterium]